ncbi:uncharacterized protein LOC132700134 [Cylas formicarius]|uniref:uncharacterized protein LOC132700134 n=1 Tax=Cylas formicarius TaxID=197179 RepID=UPI0029589869|nr:uncharacterized protein LOC132700134 [Cylas formicarius]
MLSTIRKKLRWVKEWLQKRNEYSHVNLFEELRLEPADWHNYLRMDVETYGELLKLVTPLQKQDTLMRPAIFVDEKLTSTFRFLATGRGYEDLNFTTIISPQALGRIIPETCVAIYSVLKNEFMKFPATTAEWKVISKGFEKICNFPNCLGAAGGKHVRITAPPASGSYFWNYKSYNSLVLMAVANANYEFILCDFGTNLRISDGGVIEDILFYTKLKEGKLSIPLPEQPVGSLLLPFVFIGDEAFALRSDFLKPLNQRELNHDKKKFQL